MEPCLIGKECEDDALFSLNLLLQAGYDKSKQEALLGKLGASFKLIESVLGTLSGIRIAQAVKAKTNEKLGK